MKVAIVLFYAFLSAHILQYTFRSVLICSKITYAMLSIENDEYRSYCLITNILIQILISSRLNFKFLHYDCTGE